MNACIRPLSVAMILLLPSAVWFNGCSGLGSAKQGQPVDFVTQVKPVLEHFCLECHNSKSARTAGGLNLETDRTAMTTGRHSPIIRAGNPDASLLFLVLRLGHEHPMAMPPAPDKVSDRQLAAVRDWIREGAVWPQGPEGHLHVPQ